MSKLKYTPGPWTTDGVYIEDYDNNCPLRRRIAIIDDGAGIDRPEANARLIAAAPEMLESLMFCFKEMHEEYTSDEGGLRPYQEKQYYAIKSIIEKASGLTIEEVLKCTE